jgi:hypothetical protein
MLQTKAAYDKSDTYVNGWQHPRIECQSLLVVVQPATAQAHQITIAIGIVAISSVLAQCYQQIQQLKNQHVHQSAGFGVSTGDAFHVHGNQTKATLETTLLYASNQPATIVCRGMERRSFR